MSGSSRRRVSKWDNKDSDALPESFHEKPPSRKPRESLSPSRAPRRQESRSRESMVPWGREGNGARSPGIDDWGDRHHSCSPRNDRGRSYRSRSRSRSRSPAQNSRREPQRNDRSRSRSAVSGQMCRDFPTGRCRKGNHCQFIHQDVELYDGARPLKGSSPDEWDNRPQRMGGGSRYSPDDTKDSAARNERYAHHDSMPDVIEKGPAEDSYRERKSDHRSRDAYPDRNRDRETPMCKFFAAGGCRNGNRCRFSHQVNKEGLSTERRSQDARQGSNRKFENDAVWDGPTWNDTTGMLDNTVGQGWGDDKNEIQEPSAKEMTNTVRRSQDARQGSNRNFENDPVWNGPTWNDATGTLDNTVVHGWGDDKNEIQEPSAKEMTTTVRRSQDARQGSNRKFENDPVWNGPTWNDATGTLDNTVVQGWVDNKNEIQEPSAKEMTNTVRRSQDARQGSNRKFENDPVWDGPTWNDATGMLDDTVVQGWGDVKNEIQEPSAKEMTTTVRSEDDSWSQDIVNNNEPKTRDEEKPPQWKTHNGIEMSPRDIIKPISFGPMNPQPQTLPNMPFPAVTIGETSYEKHYPHRFHEPKALNDSYSQMNPSYKDNNPAAYQEEGRNGVGNSDHTPVTSKPSMNAPLPINSSVGHGQLPFPLLHSRVDGNQTQTLHNSSSFLDGNIVADGSSHVTNINTSSIPSTANLNTTVNTEQLAKLSHLSASLAQLIESRQQLPQGDTISNQADPPDMSKQYDPSSDSTESNLPNLGSRTLPCRIDQKSSDKKEPIRTSGVVNYKEPVVGSSKGNENGQKVAEGAVKAPENGPSQDMGVDDGEDDGKKSKEVKGMRVFKFALADFVKELLKPSWKDGHVSKEAYKTIVKKVVDKVIETLGPQVPQGKEKIDQYLSYSKPKLEKLVQAYVGKYQKGKV